MPQNNRCPKSKQSVYLPTAMLEEIQALADQEECSLSFLVQKAWLIARERLLKADWPRKEN